MRGELVQTITADGQTLHGFLTPSSPPLSREGSGASILHVHDLYAHFYSVPYLADLAEHLADTGWTLLSANIRYDAPPGTPPDMAVWLDWLTAREYSPVVLVGHGLGACTVVDYVVSAEDRRAAGVACVSPPDQAAWTRRLGQRLDEAMAWALLMLEAGQADELIRIESLGSLSARAVRDLFGLRGLVSRFNYADRAHDWGWLAQVRVPLLVLHTDADDLSRPATDIAKTIQRHATTAPSVTTQIVAADAVGTAIAEWATRMV